MKTIRLGLTILLLFNLTLCFAQKNYSDGYIISLQNDTIHGKVRDRFPFRFHFAPNIVKFIDDNGLITKYLPKDIKGYSKAGFVEYMTIQDDFGKNFARLLVDGDIKLLTIKKSGSYSTSTPNGAGEFNTSYNSYSKDLYYLYNSSTSQTTKVYQLDFKNQMASYFSDYEKLKEIILNKELRYGDLEIIVAEYNKWKEEKTRSLYTQYSKKREVHNWGGYSPFQLHNGLISSRPAIANL